MTEFSRRPRAIPEPLVQTLLQEARALHPYCGMATCGGKVWRRQVEETSETFIRRVAGLCWEAHEEIPVLLPPQIVGVS